MSERGPDDQSIKERFPAFSVVWHRASDAKGIVCGWIELCDSTEMLWIDWGNTVGPIEPEVVTTTDPEKEFAPKE